MQVVRIVIEIPALDGLLLYLDGKTQQQVDTLTQTVIQLTAELSKANSALLGKIQKGEIPNG